MAEGPALTLPASPRPAPTKTKSGSLRRRQRAVGMAKAMIRAAPSKKKSAIRRVRGRNAHSNIHVVVRFC